MSSVLDKYRAMWNAPSSPSDDEERSVEEYTYDTLKDALAARCKEENRKGKRVRAPLTDEQKRHKSEMDKLSKLRRREAREAMLQGVQNEGVVTGNGELEELQRQKKGRGKEDVGNTGGGSGSDTETDDDDHHRPSGKFHVLNGLGRHVSIKTTSGQIIPPPEIIHIDTSLHCGNCNKDILLRR